MPLILLIIQIISAIPSLIKIIEEIMKIIHALPGPEKRAAEIQLKGILSNHLALGDEAMAKQDLEMFHGNLKGKYGV